MLDGGYDSVTEHSCEEDLRGIVDRLKLFDNFLSQASKDVLDDILLHDHADQSLLELDESIPVTINKSNTDSQQPAKHEGILEKIMAMPAIPIIPLNTNEKSASSIRSATLSRRLPEVDKGLLVGVHQTNVDRNSREQEQGHHDTKFEKGKRAKQDRHPSSLGNSTSRIEKKLVKEMSMKKRDTTIVSGTEQETRIVPKVSSYPGLHKCQQKHKQQQRREGKADSLSRSLHIHDQSSRTESSIKRHSRHALYSSMLGRRYVHGDRGRMTTKSTSKELLTNKSENPPTLNSNFSTTLERKSGSGCMALSSTLNQGEEDSIRGQSLSPSCPRPQLVRRPRTISPQRQVSKDCQDAKKSQSRRSPGYIRTLLSKSLHSPSTPRTSPSGRRDKVSSAQVVRDGERPEYRRSRSAEDIVHHSVTSSRDLPRTSTNRRRFKSGSHDESNKQSRNESLKRMDSLPPSFGAGGGSGIMATTPTGQVKRLASSGSSRSPIPPNHNQ